MNFVESALATHILITSLCETKIQTRRRLGTYMINPYIVQDIQSMAQSQTVSFDVMFWCISFDDPSICLSNNEGTVYHLIIWLFKLWHTSNNNNKEIIWQLQPCQEYIALCNYKKANTCSFVLSITGHVKKDIGKSFPVQLVWRKRSIFGERQTWDLFRSPQKPIRNFLQLTLFN